MCLLNCHFEFLSFGWKFSLQRSKPTLSSFWERWSEDNISSSIMMSSILCSFFVIFFRWSTWSESFLLLPLGDNYLTLCSLCQWFSLQPSQEISLGLSLMCRHATYKIIDSLLLRFFPLQHQSSRIKCYSPQKLLNLWMNRFFFCRRNKYYRFDLF